MSREHQSRTRVSHLFTSNAPDPAQKRTTHLGTYHNLQNYDCVAERAHSCADEEPTFLSPLSPPSPSLLTRASLCPQSSSNFLLKNSSNSPLFLRSCALHASLNHCGSCLPCAKFSTYAAQSARKASSLMRLSKSGRAASVSASRMRAGSGKRERISRRSSRVREDHARGCVRRVLWEVSPMFSWGRS